jgi:hypothetical protein
MNSSTKNNKPVKNPKNVIINDFSLSNPENYKDVIEKPKDVILMNYFQIICEFLNITLNKKNSSVSIITGFETITHVFLNLLFYTNNIELTCHYSEKAGYLYNEYIEQLCQEDNSKFFIKMKSYDSILFVYKNTIYNIVKKNKSIAINTTNPEIQLNRKLIDKELENIISVYKQKLIDYLSIHTNDKEYNILDLMSTLTIT